MGESGSESRSDSQSDFGVKISIQALKGHPFVILEGNDAKKKYVPAPKQSDFEQTDDQSYDRYVFLPYHKCMDHIIWSIIWTRYCGQYYMDHIIWSIL